MLFQLQLGQFGRTLAPIDTDTSFSSVKLLMHFDNNFTDNSPSPRTVTATNGAAASSTRSQFGGFSAFFDGTNDYCTTNLGSITSTGALTVESWVRVTGAQTGRIVSWQDSSTTNPLLAFRVNSDGSVALLMRKSDGTGLVNCVTAASAIATNDSAWSHVAGTRDGSGNIVVWVNGVSSATATSTVDFGTPPRSFDIGSQYGTGEFFKGYIDDLRITAGVCRYTGTFTPPTAAFPNS